MKIRTAAGTMRAILLLAVRGATESAAEPPWAPDPAIRYSRGYVSLEWLSRIDEVYQLQDADRLTGGEWRTSGGYLLGNGDVLTVQVPPVEDRMSAFYRVHVRDVPVVRVAELGERVGDTLAAAVDALSGNPALLCLGEGEWQMASVVSVPTNVTIRVEPGSRLIGHGGLSFDGGFLADGAETIFATHTVVTGLRQAVRPEWWGFCPDASIPTNREALLRALQAACPPRAAVELPEGAFAVGSVTLCATDVTIRGRAPGVYDGSTRTLRGGSRLAGRLCLDGAHLALQKLSIEHAPGSGDPMLLVKGVNCSLRDVSLLGDTNAVENAHNVFFAGTNGTAAHVASYNCGGHGFVSKSVGLNAEHILCHNCRYGVTLKSGGDGALRVVSNVLRHVTVTSDAYRDGYGLILMATQGQNMQDVVVSDYSADGLYMGIDLETAGGCTMRDVRIENANVVDCSYGYRSYISTPGVMTNVTLSACEARACSVGYLQQAPGTWIDVMLSTARGCTVPVAGSFRTADITVEP